MNIKYATILILFVTFFVSQTKAQEEIIYDQYYFNYYLVNPAIAGAERCTHLMLTGKFQWVGLQDAPMTQTFSFRTRILNNVGLGAYVYNDRNGYSYRQGGQLTFAYHIPLSENSGYFMKERSYERQLSFGISAKVNHFNFSDLLFSPDNAGDIVIDNGGSDKGFYFNANFGTYFIWDNFFAGLSATNLIPSKMVEFGSDEPIPPLSAFFFTGYDINMSHEMTLEPNVMFKMNELTNKQLDINMKFMQTLPDNEDFSYWLQVSYRQGLDAGNTQPLSLSPMGGLRYGGFHLAYAYTLGLTGINRHNSGTHEIMLGYTWCATKNFCR
jgi:type IX secretion system PorP/SprF family membrane protein